MRNPRPRSAGFIAIDARTGEILSELSARRKPAHDAVREHVAKGGHANIGVHQVLLYPGQTYDRATYKP
jgi:hypothetical protein